MSSWQHFIESQQTQSYYQQLVNKVEVERQQGKSIFPPQDNVLAAFDYTPLDKVKVVILGQDPYHGPDQAHGLAFSVLPGIKPPPSLANIYKELALEYPDYRIPQHGFLEYWAQQGVLLLNTVLTVEQGKAHSHSRFGWERFTDKALDYIDQHRQGVVFLLWGAHAQKKAKRIDHKRHHLLMAPHPSPLSAHRGFLGCNHFTQCNDLLTADGKQPIDWQIPV